MNLFLLFSAVRGQQVITEIRGMLAHVAPDYAGNKLHNYGCTGRGELDPQEKNLGDPIDELDRQINHWKQCRRCARNHFEADEDKTNTYDFNATTIHCDSAPFSLSRSICECDYEFAYNLQGVDVEENHQNIDASFCTLKRNARNRPNHGCCQKPSGAFVWYNANLRCCDSSGRLKDIGFCQSA